MKDKLNNGISPSRAGQSRGKVNLDGPRSNAVERVILARPYRDAILTRCKLRRVVFVKIGMESIATRTIVADFKLVILTGNGFQTKRRTAALFKNKISKRVMH